MGRPVLCVVSWSLNRVWCARTWQGRPDGPLHPELRPPITAPGVSPSPRSQHTMHSSSGHPAVQQGGLRCWPRRGCSSVKSASPRLVGACNCLIARLTLTAVPNLLPCHLQARFPLQWVVIFASSRGRPFCLWEHQSPFASIAQNRLRALGFGELFFAQLIPWIFLNPSLQLELKTYICGQWRLWRSWGHYWWALQLRSAHCGGRFHGLFVFFFLLLLFCLCGPDTWVWSLSLLEPYLFMRPLSAPRLMIVQFLKKKLFTMLTASKHWSCCLHNKI